MAFINEVRISGKVLRDAEKHGAWKFTIVQGGGLKRDGSGRWPNEYFNCESWHDSGQVKGGTVVTITGRLKQREWTAPSGDRRRFYQIVAQQIEVEQSQPTNTAPPLTPKFPIPDHPVRKHTVGVAEARPVTEQDPITDADIPF